MTSFGLRFFGSVGFVALALGALACSATQTARYGRNGWRITCGENMSSCAGRADTVCGDKGYTVVGGGTQSTMLGGTNGYQTKSRSSELIVRCGEASAEGGEEASEEPVEGTFKLPPRSDEPVATPAAPPVAAPKQSCLPGETRKCIGPAACEGGHACLADGSGFGPCDCGGTPAATSAAPAAPESSTWSSAAPAPSTASAPTAAPAPAPAAPAAPGKRP